MKVFVFLAIAVVSVQAGDEVKELTKEEKLQMMKDMVKKMCAAEPAKQLAWEQCCVVNKHLVSTHVRDKSINPIHDCRATRSRKSARRKPSVHPRPSV